MSDGPLYRTEAEVARAVLGKCSLESWKGLSVVLERQGLPQIDPVFGLRYWPAVEAWFQRRAGLVSVDVPATVDGQENWDCQDEVKRRGSNGARAPAENVVRIGSRGQTSSKPDTDQRPSR